MRFGDYLIQSILYFLLLFVFIVSACVNNRKQPEKKDQIPKPQIELLTEDGKLLFDGETLNNWEITQFGTQGPVSVSDDCIVLNYGDGCTGITYQNKFPKNNYQILLEAKKTSGNDFFCGMTFPVKDEFCSLIVGGWGGPVIGLSCIDGKDASDNETKVLKRFDKDVWYKIKLQVTNERIIAWVDDEKLVDFAYKGHELYIRPEVELSKPFGICTWITTAHLRNIRMKEL